MSTIFADKFRRELVPQTYSPDKRLICFLHLEIAHKIFSLHGILPEERRELLDLVDEAFDRGKRMDAALAEYRYETVEEPE